MALTPATNRQLPQEAILDHFNKQNYLGNSFLVSTDLVTTTNTETPLLILPMISQQKNIRFKMLGKNYMKDYKIISMILKVNHQASNKINYSLLN